MRILIFGGTTEGRLTALEHMEAGDTVLVCVATPEGKKQLPDQVPCRVGRLDEPAMEAVTREFDAERIVDATHPFARIVTENVRACAAALSLPYERVYRASDEAADFADTVTWVDSTEEAAEQLKRLQGNVFLSTGSNTVGLYASAIAPERLYVRVLPTRASIEKCESAGIPTPHILGMQGPFSPELNAALYRLWDIRVLVSKDSGSVGGVREKVLPALEAGIEVIMIRRPNGEEKKDAR